MSDKLKKVIKGVICAVFWIGLWEIAALLLDKHVILPTPVKTVVRLWELLGTGGFYSAVGYSLLHVFLGFAIGVVLGTLLAVLSKAGADFIISPAVSVIRSVPVASVIIVMLFFLGRESVPAVTVILMVTPVIYQNVLKGFSSVDQKQKEVAKVFGFSRFKQFKLCTLPAVLPFFSAGIKTSIGLAWKAGIAAEVICTPKISVGTMLYDAKIYLESADLFAWTLTIVILSILIEKVLAVGIDRLSGRRAHA